MTTFSYYADTDCTDIIKQIHKWQSSIFINPGNLMMQYQSKAYWIGWTRKMWKIFADIKCLWNILQFTEYLISSTSDFFRRKWKWHTTSNITYIYIHSFIHTYIHIHFIHPAFVHWWVNMKHVRRCTLHNATWPKETINNNINDKVSTKSSITKYECLKNR
jgi:hypothetical protein